MTRNLLRAACPFGLLRVGGTGGALVSKSNYYPRALFLLFFLCFLINLLFLHRYVQRGRLPSKIRVTFSIKHFGKPGKKRTRAIFPSSRKPSFDMSKFCSLFKALLRFIFFFTTDMAKLKATFESLFPFLISHGWFGSAHHT